MNHPLLQLSSVTKSLGAVCALKGVSFDLRASASGQPGGLPEISRGLSAATPPENIRKTNCTPEGCKNNSHINTHRFERERASSTPSGCISVLLALRGYRRRRLYPRLISVNPPGSTINII
jgi:hypothetical protein